MSEPVFKKDKVFQKFNLRTLFGVDISEMPEIAEAFAQIAIERIRERTDSGEFLPGSRPSAKALKYSNDYAESIAFKAAGKSQGEVNMNLTGDMMNTLDVISQSGNVVEIGWEDSTQAAKAYNHNTGDTVPRRPFFGLSPSEIKQISSEFKAEVKEAKRLFKLEGRDAATEFALSLLDKVRKVEDDIGEE